jgi:hypothetical protein
LQQASIEHAKGSVLHWHDFEVLPGQELQELYFYFVRIHFQPILTTCHPPDDSPGIKLAKEHPTTKKRRNPSFFRHGLCAVVA